METNCTPDSKTIIDLQEKLVTAKKKYRNLVDEMNILKETLRSNQTMLEQLLNEKSELEKVRIKKTQKLLIGCMILQ